MGQGEEDIAESVLIDNNVASTEAEAGDDSHGVCRNCGAILHGRYCSMCAQPVQLHRSLASLGHDILHGVFHLEGKIWRTLPELFFHPGRLTRRYIDGERARFISPMALFLFAVFLMFAVFSITGGALVNESDRRVRDGETNLMISNPDDWRSGLRRSIRQADAQVEALRQELSEGQVSSERRATLERELGELQIARAAMDAVAKQEWSRLRELGGGSMPDFPPQGVASQASKRSAAEAQRTAADDELKIELGWPALDNKLTEGLRQLNEDPQFLLYKLKSNGYKFSWALIPMSLPFLWLMFFWRRDVHLYDHAVFVTYSISFVMLLLILLSIAAALGVSADITETAMIALPPIHLYKQLRGAYGVSRTGALVRLFLLLISTGIVLVVFCLLLLVFGALD